MGFTASHLARRCGLTVSRVQDYIHGRVQAQRVEIFERVADGLHIPGSMFDLAPRAWERRLATVAEAAGAADTEPATGNGDPSVLRRDFMKLGAGMAATTLAAARMPGMPSRTAGNRIGASTVAELKDDIVRLRRLDDHLGGADTFKYYEVEVEKTAALIREGSYSGATRRDLLNLFAEQAQQAGWAAFDAGWQDKAKELYERSFGAAKEASNPELAGNALALRSYQLLSAGTVATDLTDKSCAIAEKSIEPAVKSLLFQRGAWTYAIAGQAERAAQALGKAEEALQSPAGTAPDWAAWAHNWTEWQIMVGRCWTELRRPLRAVPALESAMAQYDDSHARDKALYLSWLADAYLDAGEIEPAATALGRAFDLSANVASSRPQGRLTTVLDRFEEHKAASGVADLLARRPLNPVEIRS
ncbi:tetratricopeptide repeat protein [Amycolatopsis alkalitolerans]|uniref:XRE family transcriptional regulator n=1 Tax=Amycolatopsis alkalitolerans TaxID=2547244 RepID=A0A5C4LSJ8_9PSEU|nr:XRE family transcriptional regulator [Amycolatopsis alkalitolerans]TNC20888.1 XRE family transcriptional regulator [Amycolatopsis alkalitolerans]